MILKHTYMPTYMPTSDKDTLHIGIDDTDSVSGKCTTHLAFKIVGNILKDKLAHFIDYPLLIRLNPNIPWKTRGNGAICLRLKTGYRDKVIDLITRYVEKQAHIGSGANPGVVILNGSYIPRMIQEFARKAMFDILSKQKAEQIIRQSGNIQYFTYGNGQGLVGSLASVGCLLLEDHTYEAIAYRRQENCYTDRIVDPIKVIKFSTETFPNTFNSYDYRHRRVLIAPHGPDPVFCGIRGESPEVVVSSLRRIKPIEQLEGYMVFRTNQGTNMHLHNKLKLKEIKTYTAGFSLCMVSTKPHAIAGGHVLFTVDDWSGSKSSVAVYEPTDMTNIASMLEVGDIIEIGFGVRKPTSKHPKILNMEYLFVIQLAQKYCTFNPLCRHCGKRMKSEGKSKGFQCDRCGYKNSYAEKIHLTVDRNLKRGLYLPTPKSQRHLTKPLHRYGMEKVSSPITSEVELFFRWFSSSITRKTGSLLSLGA